MASNPDFTKIVFKDVEFSWPRLDQPYRYDQHKKESVPCPPGAQNAGYSIAWTIDAERGEAFRKGMQDHYNACRARKSDLPDFSEVFGMKRNEDGTYQITAKKSAMNNDGQENKPPAVIDLYHEELADKKIWSGSKGSVRIFAYPSTNPQNGAGGISLSLSAVQVSEAKYGGDGFEDDFGQPLEKGWGDQSENPGHGMDDTIPF